MASPLPLLAFYEDLENMEIARTIYTELRQVRYIPKTDAEGFSPLTRSN
jgi:hypothetical protein